MVNLSSTTRSARSAATAAPASASHPFPPAGPLAKAGGAASPVPATAALDQDINTLKLRRRKVDLSLAFGPHADIVTESATLQELQSQASAGAGCCVNVGCFGYLTTLYHDFSTMQ